MRDFIELWPDRSKADVNGPIDKELFNFRFGRGLSGNQVMLIEKGWIHNRVLPAQIPLIFPGNMLQDVGSTVICEHLEVI